MGKKAAKFASSGQLKKTIDARRKHQQIRKKKLEQKVRARRDDDEEENEPSSSKPAAKGKKRMTVDDFLGGGFMEGSDGDEDGDEEEFADDESFGEVDGLDGVYFALLFLPNLSDYAEEGDAHLVELSKLAEKDPEFYNTHRSLRALRKLLIAFRSAAHMNEDGQVLAWSIDNSSGNSCLLHHAPYKSLPNGKFKPPHADAEAQGASKNDPFIFPECGPILSQLTDNEMLQVAVTESAKIIPYIVSSRKVVKVYLKHSDLLAFLAIRKLASATDESILDSVLKGTYLAFVRSSKSTSAHTLPSINLMKNSASEVFSLDPAVAYQHAFGYIRQLAIHLRNSMKVKTKEAYKQVYNWQYIHCIDFWSIVLARACDAATESETGKESELEPLIYPLVQVSLGAIKLIPNSRSYPFHLHVIRSLLHLTRHTHTYYLKTRIYAEGLVEEAVYLLGEWLASPAVHGSIAFPETTVPVVIMLRKSIKAAKTGGASGASSAKDLGLVKGLLERIEESARWVEQKRKGVVLAPSKLGEVREWERGLVANVEDSPLGKYVKVQRKTRERRRKLVDKARQGEDEILED
ncbi:Noc2-domain-containing protein [Mycena olivaceomarginata]|nr:Noc2-domain-containing protein [Mycena olivaceomarginata]